MQFNAPGAVHTAPHNATPSSPAHHRPAARPQVAAHTHPRLWRWGRAWSRRCAGSRSAASPAGLHIGVAQQSREVVGWRQAREAQRSGSSGVVPGCAIGSGPTDSKAANAAPVNCCPASHTHITRHPAPHPPGRSGSGAQSSGWKRSSSWHTRCSGRPGTTSRRMEASVSTCGTGRAGQDTAGAEPCQHNQPVGNEAA